MTGLGFFRRLEGIGCTYWIGQRPFPPTPEIPLAFSSESWAHSFLSSFMGSMEWTRLRSLAIEADVMHGHILHDSEVLNLLASMIMSGRIVVFKRDHQRTMLAPPKTRTETVTPVEDLHTWVGIEVVDEHERPVSGVNYALVLSDGREIQGTVDRAGMARVDGIKIGVDAKVWVGTHDAGSKPGEYTVGRGECVRQIAATRGHSDWQLVWNHSGNQALRSKRQDPAVLLEGDVLYVPAVPRMFKAARVGEYNRFVIKKPMCSIAIRLHDAKGEGHANKACRVRYAGTVLDGKTDAKGILTQTVPATLTRIDVLVWLNDKAERPEPGDDPYDDEGMDGVHALALLPGELDPPSTVDGIEQRLANLGQFDGILQGTLSHETTVAIKRFQRRSGREPTGEIDAKTVENLCKAHGCRFTRFDGIEAHKGTHIGVHAGMGAAPRPVPLPRGQTAENPTPVVVDDTLRVMGPPRWSEPLPSGVTRDIRPRVLTELCMGLFDEDPEISRSIPHPAKDESVRGGLVSRTYSLRPVVQEIRFWNRRVCMCA